jgi:squalene synthase HpnC
MTTTARPGAAGLPSREAVMAQSGSENFPVAGLVLGRHREHLLAIYGFARLVDDTGDEGAGDRTELLDEIDRELDRIWARRAPAHPIMRTLAATVDACGLPDEPFRRLVLANRRDQSVARYETFAELMEYCQLSAAPVGELVLRVFGLADARRVQLSDQVCAGLQVVEHLQDVGEDFARGRVYLPQETLTRAGCPESDLGAASASPALRAVVAELGGASHRLLDAGAPLTRSLSGRPRVAVAGFVAGGRSTLAALERAGHDVLGRRPRRTAAGFAAAFVRAVSGR